MLEWGVNAILKRNLEALEKKRPKLFSDLKEAIEKFEAHPEGTNGESYQILDLPTGEKNLIYMRDEPAYTGVTYPDSPSRHCEEILLKVTDLSKATMIVMFGFGLGYLLKTFMQRRTQMNFAICIIERNPAFFLHALSIHNFVELLEDEDLTFVVGEPEDNIRNHLTSFFVGNTTTDRHLRILAYPNALERDPEYYSNISQQILSTRDHSLLTLGNSVPDSMVGLTNTVDNLVYALKNTGISPLMNAFKGKVAISVAAGPSLNECWDLLKEVQGRVPIFSCDTLVQPMAKRGIAPDFFTALERDPIVTDFFRGAPIPERASLIAPQLIRKDSFEEFKGHHIVYSSTGTFCVPLNLYGLGTFFPGHSAGNLNIAAATLMGFSTVIMVGHNLAFAYKTGQSHVTGTMYPEREQQFSEEELIKTYGNFRLDTQDGEGHVQTRMEYNLFRTQIENLIASNKDRTYINTALKGAKIEGSKTMSLAEALKTYVTEDFDIYPRKKELLKPPSDKEILARLEHSNEGARKALDVVRKYKIEAQQMHASIKAKRKKIEEKEQSGLPVSVEFLNRALDEVIDLKVRAVNEDKMFYQAAVSILLPAHVAFERTVNEMPFNYSNDYDLKRDFLLAHQQYFEIWNAFLPDMESLYEKAVAETQEAVDKLKRQGVSSERPISATEATV